MIEEIRIKFAKNEFEFSKHAADQSILRKIRVSEIRQATDSGEIIEDYPSDKYGPSCLIFGLTNRGMPLHVQCTYPAIPMIKIVTTYEPTPKRWIDFKLRRKQSD